MSYTEKICKLCGKSFIPKSSRQAYCKGPVEKVCPVCGEAYTTICSPDAPKSCSKPECKKKIGYIGSISAKKICKICGSEFVGTSSTQQYCNKPVTRVCQVCGKEFTIKCTAEEYNKKTCSVECMNKLASENRQISYMENNTRICELCGKEFHPRSNTQKVCEGQHYAICKVCGKKFELNYKSSTGQVDLRKTCSNECFRKLYSIYNFAGSAQCQEKRKQTCLLRYGVAHPMQNAEIARRTFDSYKERTGYDHPSHNPETLKGKKLSVSSLEVKLLTILSNNKVVYEQQKLVSKGKIHHAFDFFLPDYNVFIDADGSYYHGYLDDSNGNQVSEDRDNIRTFLIDCNQIYIVISESNFSNDVNQLLTLLKRLKSDSFDYSEYMFNWCRSIEFPYPTYGDKRLRRDYANLCKYSTDRYSSSAKMSISTIRHFHKSIYDAHVGTNISLKQAWYNDEILKKVIRNRMIYINNADPSKILSGFYISKIVPKVSVFNPVLARYLVLKYLYEFDEVTDPFSGYSGRMLGVTSTGKRYIGYDLNAAAVEESNEIIQFHCLDASVSTRNLLSEFQSTCDCILTCPPYDHKETYSSENTYKTCDEWIDIVLKKFNCKRYVFVVDSAPLHSEYIVEELVTKSYFNNIYEYVVVIDKGGTTLADFER